MTDDNKAKLLDRIRKLLALSTSPNENEAAAAAEKAQVMLAEYNLSLADLEQSKPDDVKLDGSCKTDSSPWRRPLATAVAHLYFCKYFYMMEYEYTATRSCGYIRHDVHAFVGAEHNLAVAKSMFEYLEKTVDRLARSGAGKRAADAKSQYITSFRNACVIRLTRRIWEMVEAAKKGQTRTASGTNLPAMLNLYEQTNKQLEAFIAKNVGKLQSKATRRTINNAAGAEDGRRAGESIGLNPQVKGRAAAGMIGR